MTDSRGLSQQAVRGGRGFKRYATLMEMIQDSQMLYVLVRGDAEDSRHLNEEVIENGVHHNVVLTWFRDVFAKGDSCLVAEPMVPMELEQLVYQVKQWKMENGLTVAVHPMAQKPHVVWR